MITMCALTEVVRFADPNACRCSGIICLRPRFPRPLGPCRVDFRIVAHPPHQRQNARTFETWGVERLQVSDKHAWSFGTRFVDKA